MGIEPSCILTLRDELPDLVRGRTTDFCDNRRSLHTAELLAMAG